MELLIIQIILITIQIVLFYYIYKIRQGMKNDLKHWYKVFPEDE